MTTQTQPDQRDGTYSRWNLSASAWSGAEYGEDCIIVTHDAATGEWHARTEFNQSTHRDLDDQELASVRAEFNLTA